MRGRYCVCWCEGNKYITFVLTELRLRGCFLCPQSLVPPITNTSRVPLKWMGAPLSLPRKELAGKSLSSFEVCEYEHLQWQVATSVGVCYIQCFVDE